MTDDDDSLRSRNINFAPRPDGDDDLLNAFGEAYDKTDPTTQQSAMGKDHEAFMTLLNVAGLVDTVAGWAVDHVYGLSIAGHRMLPLQPQTGRLNQAYVVSRLLADVHDHEINGGAAFQSFENDPPSDPKLRRLILRNLVFSGACALPDWLRNEIVEALDALDNGTIMPLLKPAKRVGTDYVTALAQLRIVAFVEYRVEAYSVSEESARNFIGQKMGRTAEALKGWEQRLKKSCLGPLEVDRRIRFAKNAGGYVRRAIELKTNGEAGKAAERDIRRGEHHERMWDLHALDRAIAQWKAAEGIAAD